VGYRCRNCINRQQQVFYADFRPIFYLVAAIVALPLGLAAGWIVPDLGWFALFLGPLAGMGIAEAVQWAIGRRRGPHTWAVVGLCVLLGGLPKFVTGMQVLLLSLSALGSVDMGQTWLLIWSAVYLFSAVGAVSTRLRPPRRK
jgi:hypothetical protein